MNKGNIILALLILFVGLPACQNNEAVSINSQHNSITPIESPSEPQAEGIESSPYWWTPPEKPTPAMINDDVYWEQQFWYIFNAYPNKYEWGDEPGMNNNHQLWGGDEPRMLGFVPLLYRDGIIGQLEKNRDSKIQNAILQLEDFSTLTALYFGPNFATGITPGNAQFSGTVVNNEPVRVLYENGEFLIPFTMKYTELSTNLGFKFMKVIPLEDDLSRVEFVANGYNIVWGRDGEDDSLILSRTHSYILRWDGRVGYVPEKITWEYLPTDRVSLQGDNIQEIPVLWDNAEPTGYAHQAYRGQTDDMLMSYHPIHVNGEDVYQFRMENNKILYDKINLETLEQSIGNTLISAKSDPAHVIWRVGDGVALFADNTLYQFDGMLHLQNQVSIPESVRMDKYFAAIDEQFTMVAFFVENDLYLYDFEQEESRLIYTHVYEEGIDVLDGQWNAMHPVRFTDEGYIFIRISGWEASAYQYLLLNQKGEKLAVMNWHVSEELGGGYSFSNSAGAFHDHGYDDSTSWRYINFTNQELKDIPHMPFNFSGSIGMIAIPSPQIRHQWYLSEPRDPWEMPDETAFYIIDFDAGTCTELPLKVIGARASLMAVSESGRLLFNYAYNGERGYGVYTPSAV